MNVFANHGLTVMSLGEIIIEDGVMMGPEVGLFTVNHEPENIRVIGTGSIVVKDIPDNAVAVMSEIIKQDFWYEPGNGNRRLHIYLPEGYNNTEERYPVMYFFDGHNLYFNEDATYGSPGFQRKSGSFVGIDPKRDGFHPRGSG